MSSSAHAGRKAGRDVMQTADLTSYAVVASVTGVIVIICVLLHYEALSLLTGVLKRIRIQPRPRILVMILTILAIHVMEIWIFGFGYWGLMQNAAHGQLVATHPIGLLDCVYYSAVCYTTLGLGDLTPVGNIRFLTGMESLTGFVLIGWSVSFTYLEMDRFWRG
jgi:small-conductance mechanosensitive channel